MASVKEKFVGAWRLVLEINVEEEDKLNGGLIEGTSVSWISRG
jgi:hypothetical protein